MAGTGAAVPSDAIDDLKVNAETIDGVVNSGALTVQGRETPENPAGKTIKTLAGIEAEADALLGQIQDDFDAAQAGEFVAASQAAQLAAETAADVAMTAGWVYPNAAAGEAARTDGDYFWVVSADSSEVLELWLMGAVTATDTGKRTVSKNYATQRKDSLYNFYNAEVEKGENLYNYKNALAGFTINSGTGELSTDVNKAASDFIPVIASSDYAMTPSTGVVWAQYDVSKNFISSGFTSTFTASEMARYVRIVFNDYQRYRGTLVQASSVSVHTPYKAVHRLNRESFVNNSIQHENVGFLSVNSYNLFDKNDVLENYNIASTFGSLEENTNFVCSARYIPADEAFVISSNNSVAVGFYDEDKKTLGRIALTSASSPQAMPVGTKFVRFGVAKGLVDSLVVAYGDELTSAEPRNNSVETQGIHIGSGNVDFLKQGINVFDANDVINGYDFGANGEIEVDSTRCISRQYLTVAGSTLHISYPTNAQIVWYDREKQIISREVLGWSSPKTAPSGAAYFRICVTKDEAFGVAVQWDNSEVRHEKFGYRLDKSKLIPYHGIEQNKIVFPPRIPDGYYRPVGSFNYANYQYQASSYSFASFESEWAALLAANTDYLTSETLGLDESGNYTIIKVTAKPPVPDIRRNYKLPKIVIVAGIHGGEKHSMFDTFLFVKDVCENWQSDPVLEFFRWNCELVIIPYASPWAFDNDSRKNSNGVDLNRNFEIFWEDGNSDPSSQFYRGASPLSELEAQYVDQVISENTDALLIMDHHNSNNPATDKLIWSDLIQYDGYDAAIGMATRQVLTDCTNSFRANYGVTSNGFAGYISQTLEPTVKCQAYYKYGVPAYTFETFKEATEMTDIATALKACVEVLGNKLINIIRAFKQYS